MASCGPGLDGVLQGDQAGGLAVHGHPDGCGAALLLRHQGCAVGLGKLDAVFLQPACPAGQHGAAFDDGTHAAAGGGGEVRPPRAVRPGRGHAPAMAWAMGCSLWDSTAPARRRTLGRRQLGEGDDVDHAQLALGDGARLVQQDGVHRAGVLQDLRALDQDAQLGGAAGSRQQANGCGQAQGAGAGDDQNGDGGREGGLNVTAEDQPQGKGDDGNDQHDRHKHGADPVRQAGDGCLAGLRGADELAHLGQRGLGADAGGPHQQPAGGVDRGARDGVIHA